MDKNRFSSFYSQLLQKYEETLTIDKAILSMVFTSESQELAIEKLLQFFKDEYKASSLDLWFYDSTYNRYYPFDSSIPIRHVSHSASHSLTAFQFEQFFGKDDMFFTDDIYKIKAIETSLNKLDSNDNSLLTLALPTINLGKVIIYSPKKYHASMILSDLLKRILLIIDALITAETVDYDLFLNEDTDININVFLALEKTYDYYTYIHELKVSKIVKAIASYLKLPYYDVLKLSLAGRVHDIGNLFIPKHLLYKEGPISNEESNLLKTHVTMGIEILNQLGFNTDIIKLVLEHHERYDGSGYPLGLKKYQWTLQSQIIAISDELALLNLENQYHEKNDSVTSIYDLFIMKGNKYSDDLIDTIEEMFKAKVLLPLIK